MIQKGSKVKIHYIGTKNDGFEFDNSYKKGQTLDFEVGSGKVISGLDEGLIGMEVGEKKSIKIPVEKAYGIRRPEGVMKVPLENFPPDFSANPGEMIQGKTEGGHDVFAVVVNKEDDGIVLDMNHPLAGEELNFDVELVDIE
jgi:FKBP-type peptidyl-prolyl cis-trans isomerase 2